MDRFSHFGRTFPAAAPDSAHWTERVVTQGHADYCKQYGHATWTEDGVTRPRCPRCGDTLTPEPTPEPLPEDGEEGIYGIKPVDPATPGAMVCGDCGQAWMEDITPAGRCPWEYDHETEEEREEEREWNAANARRWAAGAPARARAAYLRSAWGF